MQSYIKIQGRMTCGQRHLWTCMSVSQAKIKAEKQQQQQQQQPLSSPFADTYRPNVC